MTRQLTWRRTFETSSRPGHPVPHDFTASLDGRDIGRIYRHSDKVRWQFFAWLADGSGENGVCDSREMVIDEIRRRGLKPAAK